MDHVEITRICSSCGDEKPISDFPTDKRKKYGKSHKCKECKKLYTKEYWQRDDVKVREAARRRNRPKYKVKQAAHCKKYRLTQRYKDYLHAMRKSKRQNDPKFRLHESMSARIRHDLKNGKEGMALGEILKNHLGYSIKDLMKHLEKKFKPGMSWGNYGEWHIDHKIPVAAFNFETVKDIDFQKCWSLKNLQPLWREENLIKNAKLERPHQPSLTISTGG